TVKACWREFRSRRSRTPSSRTPRAQLPAAPSARPPSTSGMRFFSARTASAPSKRKLPPRALEPEAGAAVASHLVVVDHQAVRGRHPLAGEEKPARAFPRLERVVGGHARLTLDQLGAAGATHAPLAGVGYANALGQGGVDHVAAPGHHKGMLDAIEDGDGLSAFAWAG